jgi:hypothetical protein
MGQSLGLAGTDDRAGGPLPAVRHARNRRAAKSPASDLDFARATRANLLLVGTEPAVSNLVCSLWSTFDEPLMIRRSGDRLHLPSGSEPVGTMIIHGVETLTEYEQRALQDWLLLRTGRTRVVSTASASLLPRVEDGAFNDSLYYRLNVVCIDLSSR